MRCLLKRGSNSMQILFREFCLADVISTAILTANIETELITSYQSLLVEKFSLASLWDETIEAYVEVFTKWGLSTVGELEVFVVMSAEIFYKIENTYIICQTGIGNHLYITIHNQWVVFQDSMRVLGFKWNLKTLLPVQILADTYTFKFHLLLENTMTHFGFSSPRRQLV